MVQPKAVAGIGVPAVSPRHVQLLRHLGHSTATWLHSQCLTSDETWVRRYCHRSTKTWQIFSSKKWKFMKHTNEYYNLRLVIHQFSMKSAPRNSNNQDTHVGIDCASTSWWYKFNLVKGPAKHMQEHATFCQVIAISLLLAREQNLQRQICRSMARTDACVRSHVHIVHDNDSAWSLSQNCIDTKSISFLWRRSIFADLVGPSKLLMDEIQQEFT